MVFCYIQPQTNPSAKLSSNSSTFSFSLVVPLQTSQTGKFTSLFTEISAEQACFLHTKHVLFSIITKKQKYKNKLKDFNQVIQSQLNLTFFNASKFDLLRIKSDPNNVYKNFNNYKPLG